MGEIRNCAIIVRVSEGRNARGEMNTLDIQEMEIRKFIESRNCNEQGIKYNPYRVFHLKGVSGSKSFDSRQFDELEMDIALKKVQVVICTALDRLGRDVQGFLTFYEMLKESNVQLICTRMSLDTETPLGQAMLVILMALAKLELDIKTERNRVSAKERADKGLYNGHKPILGYNLNPDPDIAGRLVVNEEEAALVRRAFKEYLRLGSDKAVADLLTQEGYLNKTWVNRKTNKTEGGGPITPAVIKTMLTNITYIAMRRVPEIDPDTGKKRQVQGVWEAIVDLDLFNKVQKMRAKSKASGGSMVKRYGDRHLYLLSGVMVCGFCGHNMETTRSGTGAEKPKSGVVATKKKPKKIYFYYKCTNDDCPFHLKDIKHWHRVDADFIDSCAYEALGRIVSTEENLREFTRMLNTRITDDLPPLRTELGNLTKKRDMFERSRIEIVKSMGKMEEGSELLTTTGADAGKLLNKIKLINKRRAEVASLVNQLQGRMLSEEQVKSYLINIKKVIQSGSEQQRRDFVRLVFRAIEVDGSEIRFMLHTEPLLFTRDLLTSKWRFRAGRGLAPQFWIRTNPFQQFLRLCLSGSFTSAKPWEATILSKSACIRDGTKARATKRWNHASGTCQKTWNDPSKSHSVVVSTGITQARNREASGDGR